MINITVCFLYNWNNKTWQWEKHLFSNISLFLQLCHYSRKLNLTMVRKSPNAAVFGLSTFLIAWILNNINMVLFFQFELKMAVHTACMKKKNCKWTTFDTFLRRVNFILMFFQEEFMPSQNIFPYFNPCENNTFCT